MKLIKLEMQNFRQYYGKQKIEFANDTIQNVTILFGENGKGKTGVYRAIMFALFGAKQISQDSQSDEKIHLTNFKYLEEQENSTGESSVEVSFTHHNYTYILKRSVKAIKRGNFIIENDSNVSLKLVDENGNTSSNIYTSKQEISLIVNEIINEDIKDFFLFDAEKIDTLAKADPAVRKEVKTAIFKMLQLDKIDDARTILKLLKDEYRRNQIYVEGKKDVQNKNEEIESLKKKITELQEITFSSVEQRDIIKETLASYELTLEKNKDIVLQNEKIDNAKKQQLTLAERLKDINSVLNSNIIENAPYILMNQTMEANNVFLENFLGDDKILIPQNLLHESLQNSRCIMCDNDLIVNNENKKYIEALVINQKYSEAYNIARDMLKMNERKGRYFEEKETQLQNHTRNYKEVLKEISIQEEVIMSLESEKNEQAKSDISLKEIVEMIRKESVSLNNYSQVIEDNNKVIQELQNRIDDINLEIDEILKNEQANKVKEEMYATYLKLDGTLKQISKEFNENMRKLLGEYTTEIFKELIDPKDKDILKYVEINGHFEITAISQNGYSIVQDISQGQRQILALSFITALAKIAVNDETQEKIEYPLFMDSPFNRLSGTNRDNLIEKLPDLTAQWILLLTDTELTPSEERVFKETHRLGKWYKINQIENHHSVIEEIGLNETMATRGQY